MSSSRPGQLGGAPSGRRGGTGGRLDGGGRGRRSGPGGPAGRSGDSSDRTPDPRRLAVDALVRIERDGAFANLALPAILDRAGGRLDRRQRAQVTDLVYGTTRMRRACDFLVDRFLPDPDALTLEARSALRLGAYQLHFAEVAPHAAVSATVDAAAPRYRKLVNAILRRVADHPVHWPDLATRLSYPDWMVARLVADLGEERAVAALETMNRAPVVTTRADGYVQDRSSQLVVEATGAQVGERVLDVCAAPGGKATGLATSGATVIASDERVGRLGLVIDNRERLAQPERLVVLAADARRLPYPDASVDRVLVDAPCSGLGALRRRPDARWRIQPDDVERLAVLQGQILDEAVRVVRPGGTVVYSVCTLTTAETAAVAEGVVSRHPELAAVEPPGQPWTALGPGGALLLPADDHDGMALFRWLRP